ncbi:hypothetical protein CAT32_11235 [Acinetobacter baumannii]|uniref:phage regulatory CII family protein n=1 Tax=Acinetobacter baumannii TaxID=470 RepID=UPI000A358EEB|nr:phage regulatory CII family protein [Acinetobacter baumannii]OTK23388.1 hypothetical protein B9X43_16280 [Acinetobacter baumannii]OTU67036.1 hypothetical protein CAT32_11235 [Acinetobacter baumannii]
MSEIHLSPEAKTAIYKIVHQSQGISPQEIADVLGDSYKSVLNYANPNMETHFPSIKKLEAMIQFTRNPALVKAWAHMLGFVLVPANQADEKAHEVSIVETLLHININNGQANQQVHKVLEDGVVTPAELADTEEILEEMENHIRQLREALKTEAATYISKVKKEKA